MGDIEHRAYYSGSLPAGHIEKEGDVIGKKLTCERKTGDPITGSVFEQIPGTSMVEELGPGEVLMALDISYIEPIIEELHAGCRISIVSTEKEKSFEPDTILSAGLVNDETEKIISPNIVVIDSQIIIKNPEIVEIRVPEKKDESLLVSTGKDNPYIFIKCSINEAPVISRITKEDKYKIFMERM